MSLQKEGYSVNSKALQQCWITSENTTALITETSLKEAKLA